MTHEIPPGYATIAGGDPTKFAARPLSDLESEFKASLAASETGAPLAITTLDHAAIWARRNGKPSPASVNAAVEALKKPDGTLDHEAIWTARNRVGGAIQRVVPRQNEPSK